MIRTILKALSVLWTIVLAILAVGATTNLLMISDVVQPYCTTAPEANGELCIPCGLRWEMFGVVGATQCPNSLIDELLTVFVVVPRLLFVLFGIAWLLTGPLLAMNFGALILRWRRGDRSTISAVQITLLAYLLLWGLAAAAFFLR